MPIFGAQNTKLYVKAPGTTPTAFAAGDLVPQNLVTNISANVSRSTVDYESYATTNTNRIAMSRDFTLSLTLVYELSDTTIAKFLNAFQSAEGTLDVLLLIGDTPATGAKNLAVYGRMVVSRFNQNPPSRNIVTVEVELQLANGATLNVAQDITAYPSL